VNAWGKRVLPFVFKKQKMAKDPIQSVARGTSGRWRATATSGESRFSALLIYKRVPSIAGLFIVLKVETKVLIAKQS
jgi:hypothetical protein